MHGDGHDSCAGHLDKIGHILFAVGGWSYVVEMDCRSNAGYVDGWNAGGMIFYQYQYKAGDATWEAVPLHSNWPKKGILPNDNFFFSFFFFSFLFLFLKM